MANELFIGNLSNEVLPRDLENAFFRYGRIVRSDVKKNFGFVTFQSQRDAEEAMRKENGRKLMGSEMNIEWAKGSVGDNRRNRSPPRGGRGPPPRFRDRSPIGRGRGPPMRGRGRRDSYGDSKFGSRRDSFSQRDRDDDRRDRFGGDRDRRPSFGGGRGGGRYGDRSDRFDDRRDRPRYEDRRGRGRGGFRGRR